MSTSLDLSLGAIEVGCLIATVLYGVATMQAYIYARNCADDPLVFKVGVLLIWLAETLLTLLNFFYLYFLTVTNYGAFDTVDDMPWSASLSFWIIGIISVAVECFYAWRILNLSKRMIIPMISWIGSLVHLAANTTIFVLSLKSKTIARYEASYDWTITLSLTVETIIDVVNTIALSYYLRKMRAQGHHRTTAMVDSLLSWTLETGLIISVCAVIMLVLNRATPADNAIWVGMLMFYPKLFSNSLLMSLNARHALRRENKTVVTGFGSNADRIGGTGRGAQRNVTVSVSQSTFQEVELTSIGRTKGSLDTMDVASMAA